MNARCATALVAAALALAVSAAAIGAPILGAGQQGQGWLAVESTWQAKPAWTLYHFPSTAPPGTAVRVRGLPSLPEAMSASDTRVVLVYPPEGPSASEMTRSVRAITAVPFFEGERFRYEPPNRGEVLPPLPGWGRLEGFLVTGDAPVALLREDGGESRRALLTLERAQWVEQPLPAELSLAAAWSLAPVDAAAGGFGIVEQQPGRAQLWTRSAETDAKPPQWGGDALPMREPGTLLQGAGGAMLSVSRSPDARVELRLLRQDRAHALGGISGVPAEHAVFGVGDNVVVAWIDTGSATRIRVGVLTSIRGEVLYEDFARMQSILTARDMQFLALLMAAVVLMIVIFVLRPEPATSADLKLPKGFTPAPPGRRAGAALIDIAPLALVSSLAWDVGFIQALGFSMDMADAGIWPLLTTMGAGLVYQTVTEWIFGATPGKLALSCRTVSLTAGPRPSLRQCVVRNVVKYACPPLTALVAADPTRRHPGDYFAGTIVVAPLPPPEPADDPPDQRPR